MFANQNQPSNQRLRSPVLGTRETAKELQINGNESGEVVVKGEGVAQVSSARGAVQFV